MRKLAPGVAISVIVHTGALAYFAVPVERHTAPTTIAAPRPVAPVADPDPIEVAFFDDPPPSVAPPLTVSRSSQSRSSPSRPQPDVAIATTTPASESPPAPTTGVTDASHSKSLLTMRPGEPRGIALPAVIVDVPHGGKPRVATGAPELHHIDGGRFDVQVAADGTVKLTDKSSVGLVLPAKQALDDYLKSDRRLGGSGGDPAIASHYEAAPGTAVNLGSTSSINATPYSSMLSRNMEKNGATVVVVPLIGGRFDATDALMRGHGADPYFARKLELLDATRDARVERGNHHRVEQLSQARQLAQRNLDALWRNPALDVAAKKRALFELWDECAEDGEALLVNGADNARQQVIAFIRGHLPAGSAAAYSPAELAELARHQQSKAVFAPYAD